MQPYRSRTIVIMYDQVKKEISLKITSIQQNYKDVILSSSQYYINQNFCLHIVTVMERPPLDGIVG